MPSEVLFQLVAILALGILAQWFAWQLRLPSILVLLAMGTLVGPVTGWLNPNELLGELLMPVVSLSVAVILYEGGLSLKLRELRQIGYTFLLLSTVGVLTSWGVATVAARILLDLSWTVATLLGALLVVTGPTVIGPMLRHLRLRGRASSLLKWEGIVVDPIGAVLAVSVFALAHSVTLNEGVTKAILEIAMTLAIGSVLGGVAAAILVFALSKFLLPDQLVNPFSLAIMFAAFAVSNMLQEESGLVAVTVMGIALANQPWVSVRHVAEFKETLTVLLISCLFVVLSARLTPDDLRRLNWQSFAFVAVMIVIARPASVLASTWGSVLTWQERCFLSCMAPRGIVAAAVSSVLAIDLLEAGFQDAGQLVPITFLVVFLTVLTYGMLSRPLALKLGLIQPNPQGILFVGASLWVRELAHFLMESGCSVFLVDTNWHNIRRCRERGLPALYGSALAEETREEIDYAGLGRMFAVTTNDQVNSLFCIHYLEDFGRKGCYQLPFSQERNGVHEPVSIEHRGRTLFGKEWTFTKLTQLAGPSPKFKTTRLTEDFDYAAYKEEHSHTVLPLFLLSPDGQLTVRTQGEDPTPKPGDSVIALVIDSPADTTATANE